MTTEPSSHRPRLTGVAPQLLVDDLPGAIEYYRDKLGFGLDFCYESFYAGVSRDGFAIHLKHGSRTPGDREHRKRQEHLDAYIGVTGVAALHEELRARGARITRPPEARPWACTDFYVEDPDGHILCFSEPTSAAPARRDPPNG